MHDRGADLRLDVVAHDGEPRVREPLGPLGVARDEHRDAVHEPGARQDRGLRVELRGLLGAHREVGHDHVDLGVAERLRHVHGRAVGLVDGLAVVLAEPVERRSALDLDARGGYVVREPDGVVGLAEDDLDVAHVIVAQHHVHEPRDVVALLGVPVILEALHQRGRAITHADDPEPDLPLGHPARSFATGERRRGARSGFTLLTFLRSSLIRTSSHLMSCCVDSSPCCIRESV